MMLGVLLIDESAPFSGDRKKMYCKKSNVASGPMIQMVIRHTNVILTNTATANRILNIITKSLKGFDYLIFFASNV